MDQVIRVSLDDVRSGDVVLEFISWFHRHDAQPPFPFLDFHFRDRRAGVKVAE